MDQVNILDVYENLGWQYRKRPEIGNFVMVVPIAGMNPTVGLVHLVSEYGLYVSTWKLGFEQQKYFGHVFSIREPKNIIYRLSTEELVEKMEGQAVDLSKKTRTKSEVGAYWAGRVFLLRELINTIKENNLQTLNPRRVILKGPKTGVYVLGNGTINRYTNENLSAFSLEESLSEEDASHIIALVFKEKFEKVTAQNQCMNFSANIFRSGYDVCEVPEHAIPWIKHIKKI